MLYKAAKSFIGAMRINLLCPSILPHVKQVHAEDFQIEVVLTFTRKERELFFSVTPNFKLLGLALRNLGRRKLIKNAQRTKRINLKFINKQG